MPAPISPIAGSPIGGIPLPQAPSLETRAPAGAFQEVFASAVRSVEANGQTASASVEQFLSGEGGELHTTILATQRAELSFDLFLQMRNKVVSAYQEIMRMQV
jgi:flagellar hook-basal body complex protein FliE